MKYYTPYPILLDFLLVMRTEYEIDYDGSQGSFYSSENRPGFFTSINLFFLRSATVNNRPLFSSLKSSLLP